MKEVTLATIKTQGLARGIPLVSDQGLALLIEEANRFRTPRILEIGGATGYSALSLAATVPGATVITLERERVLASEAARNAEQLDLAAAVTVVCADALEFTPEGLFDLVFIDAAKAQYQKFFTRFAPFVKRGGVIICDNLDFHAAGTAPQSRSVRGLVRKLAAFKAWLAANDAFETRFLATGDGMAVSRKR